MTKISTLLAAVALVMGFITACSGSSGTAETINGAAPPMTSSATAESGPAATGVPTITIERMAYGDPLTVAPGAQVRVANNDSVEHSVTSDTAGEFDLHLDGQQKGTLIAPTEPGEYPFHCVYHPFMTGTLIVQ